MRRRTLSVLALGALLLVLAAPSPAQHPHLRLAPYRPGGIYALGERVGWTITAMPGAKAAGRFRFVVRKNNQDPIRSGTLDLSSGTAALEVTSAEPAMLYLEIAPEAAPNAEPRAAGAAVAPERLRPSVPRPADFDRFWASKLRLLRAIPPRPALSPGESGRPDVEYATIRMNTVNGASIHGQVAKPRRAGRFPALLLLQWAGPPYPLQKPWVVDRATRGWLALNIQPHDVPVDAPQSFYDNLPEHRKKYESIGLEDRHRNYFLQMYLAGVRAADYLASRPDWDGKTLVVMGTSMGGQQSLCVAGLHPRITHVLVNEPAGCDTNGTLHGRKSGYPFWPADNPRAMRTALYFDPVNFASRIRVPALVGIGFVDTVTPPVGIWIAFNQLRGPKEAVPMVDSPHNHQATPEQQRPWTERSEAWLDALVREGRLPPGATEARAATR